MTLLRTGGFYLSECRYVRFSLLEVNHNQIFHTAEDLMMNMSPWNKECILGQKSPLQISPVWEIRIRLELEEKTRDLVKLKVSDVALCRAGQGMLPPVRLSDKG